jgi:hypothetical protein
MFPVCGLPEALSDTVQFAVREPAALGVNEIENVHVPLGMIVAPEMHVLVDVNWKSAALVPAMVSVLLSIRFELPLLVSVTACAAVPLPTVSVPNDRLVGEKVTPGAA